jgi:hypothetical protein
MKYRVGQRLKVKYSKDYFKEYVKFKGTKHPWDGWTNGFIENPYHFKPINKIENWRGYLNDGR